MARVVLTPEKGEQMSTIGQNVAPVARQGQPCGLQSHAHPPSQPMNPCELEIDLFCKGMRIDPSCTLECDARFISRTRAGLGSGLELVIPGPIKDVWVNVPVEEDFAQQSCYELVRDQGEYWVKDTRLRPSLRGAHSAGAGLVHAPDLARHSHAQGRGAARDLPRHLHLELVRVLVPLAGGQLQVLRHRPECGRERGGPQGHR